MLRADHVGPPRVEPLKNVAVERGLVVKLSGFIRASILSQINAPSRRFGARLKQWAQQCDRCHGINGDNVDPRAPALAGQRADYLEKGSA
jgi:cytochrome c553